MTIPVRFSVSLGLGLVLAIIAVPASAQSPSPSIPPSPAASPAAATSRVAFVPVQRFWTPRRDVSLEEVRDAIEGRGETYRRVIVAADDPASLWDALGVVPDDSTVTGTVDEVQAAVDGSRSTLGLVPAAQLRPSLRALTVDGRTLVGEDRLADLAAWPLQGGPATGPVFDPASTWTLVAGGDVMLDREVYRKSVLQRKGPDYPWDGGFARITSRDCCTKDGGPAITTKRLGPKGRVRELLSSADIAVVNHEGPAPDDFTYHPSGLVFTFDPALLDGVAAAGVDVVSLANNHIRNAGSAGVRETIRNLRDRGIRSFGAGPNERAARRPACFDRDEQRICFLGYNAINTGVHAVTADRAGAAELVLEDVRSDIRALRRDGADVIVVMPHWGPEYVTRVTDQQRRQARAMVRAGADAVLGAHSHVTGPVEFVRGVPVLYSMGDLIFDLPRFEATEEGVIVELTFHGADLVQVELHPTVIVDRSQVNLLRREADGDVVIKRMRRASRRLDRSAAFPITPSKP